MDPRVRIENLRRLLASEENPVVKPWGGKIPVGLVFPNAYSVGMANLGFQLVYYMLNREEDVVCERIFWDPQEGYPPLSLETQQPLGRFEILAFSIPFENDYAHLPQMLRSAGIPLDSARRLPPHPMVWVGGATASLNPEPIALFVDLFAIGEAEPLLPELLRKYRSCRQLRLTKKECLEEMSRIQGVYVPCLYRVKYDKRGLIRAFRPVKGAPEKVLRRVTSNLEAEVPRSFVLGPASEFESMVLVEIGRGCPRRCLFCAAGHVFSPTRHRSMESLRRVIEEGLRLRDKIGLVSSSVCDHPDLQRICAEVLSRGGKISVSSLRLDRLEDYLLEGLAKSGHKTISLAPEAGSQRLRDLIGKAIKEHQILDAVKRILSVGIGRLKLYFMVGLPTETRQDVEQIAELTKKLLHIGRKATQGKGLEKITLSVNPFVPKPWTAFQWHPLEDTSELKSRIQLIQRQLRSERRVQILYEPPKWSRIQCLLARGDRKLALVLRLVAGGATWEKALKEVNLNPDFYLYRLRDSEEIFPWDFIDQGYSKELLWRAYQKAMARAISQ
ncbi:MAG: radical SAM protein [bacterium]